MEEEFQETSKALTQAQDELRATQRELQTTLEKLRDKELELQQGAVKLRKVYKVLEKAQQVSISKNFFLCHCCCGKIS
jgi:hypothetical protein